jgi:hypothetical protein
MGVELQGNSQAGFRTDTSSEPAAGLSVGAKVGITLGAVLGFAFFLGAAVIFFLRRHKKATQSATPEGRTEPVQELPGYSSGLRKFFWGRWRAEIDGTTQRAEMETEKVYELPVPPTELEALQHQQLHTQDPAPPYETRPHLVPTIHKKEDTVNISEAVKHISG